MSNVSTASGPDWQSARLAVLLDALHGVPLSGSDHPHPADPGSSGFSCPPARGLPREHGQVTIGRRFTILAVTGLKLK